MLNKIMYPNLLQPEWCYVICNNALRYYVILNVNYNVITVNWNNN